MKYIYFTKTLRELDVPRLAEFLKSAGLDGADMAVRPGYAVEPARAEKDLPAAARTLRDHGLTVPLVSAPTGLNDPASGDAKRIFHACAAAGVPSVKIGYFGYAGKFADDFARAQKALEGFSRLAESVKVRALHHTHSGRNIGSNLESQRILLEPFDPHWIGCYADTGHQAVNGGPFSLGLQYVSRWFAAVAIKDMLIEKTAESARRRVVPAGEGIVAWKDIRAALLVDRRYEGWISLHGEYEAADLNDRLAKARREHQFLKSLLAA